MRILRIIFLILFGSVSLEMSPVFSQSYPFREYTVMDGLAQSQSTIIFQDSRGFIWIGTRNGISRFDGIEFKNYFRKDGLPSGDVSQITENSKGVWVLGKNGLSLFNGKKFVYYPAPEGSIYERFRQVIRTGDDDFIINKFNPGKGRLDLALFKDGKYFDYSGSFPSLDTLKLETIINGTNNNEFFILNCNGSLFSWKDKKLTHLPRTDFNYHVLLLDNVLTNRNEKYEYMGQIPYHNGKKNRNLIYRDNEMNDHLILKKGESEFNIKLPKGRYPAMIDSEGIVWLPGEKNVYRLISTAFSRFSSYNELIPDLWALAEDRNGHLWFGSVNGDLQEFDGKEFRLRNDFKPHLLREAVFYKGSRKISNGDIHFSTSDGVLVWDGSSFSRLKGIPRGAQICYIYEDPADKSVLFGTHVGLYHLKNDSMRVYPEFIDEKLGVIEGIVRESSGKYWLSGHNGLLMFDGVNSIQMRDSILPESDTYTIEKDKYGGLWITSEEGLFFKRYGSKKFLSILPNYVNAPANSLMMMNDSNILIGRLTDICIINLRKFYNSNSDYYRLYDRTDGFLGKDCLDNGIIKDKYGRFLILSSDGVDILDPKHLKPDTIPPRVYITDIEQVTDSLPWVSISEPDLFYNQTGKFILKWNQNNLRISFTGISTTNPEKVTYSHRLSGYEEKWSAKSSERKAVYEKIPPGNYQFELISFNADGIESTLNDKISIRIKPAIWQTLAFKIFLILLIITSSILSYVQLTKYRHRKKRESEKLQSRLSQLHMESVIRQFDPHFTFNVLSSVGSLIMSGEKELAYDYLIKLSGLLRSVLTDGSVIIKPISEELDFVQRYCEVQKLRFGERFDYSIVVNSDVNIMREVPKLTIQMFVENAIKHGLERRKEGGRIEVALENKMSCLEIRITDNGIGRAASAKLNTRGTGNGIKILTGLFEHMNTCNKVRATIELTDLFNDLENPSGTEVKIIIPDDYRFAFEQSKY